jgi:hypothetical protein
VFSNVNSTPVYGTFALSPDKIAVNYRNSELKSGVVIGVISGTTISWGAESVASDGIAGGTYVTALSSDKLAVLYRDNDDSYQGMLVIGTVAGSSVVWGPESVFSTNISYQVSLSALTSERLVLVYVDTDNSEYGTAIIGDVQPYVGVAKTSCSGGGACTVSGGGIVSGLSGLTAGSVYYAGADGVLTTTKYPNRVGVAVSTTEIALDGDFDVAIKTVSELRFDNTFRMTTLQNGSGQQGLAMYSQSSMPLITMNDSGVLTATTSIGVGTTSPTASIHVSGINGKVGLQIDSKTATATNNILLLKSNVASVDDNVFRVQANGAVYADGAYTGTGADYAEYFENEEIIPVKSLVGLNRETGKVRKYIEGDALIGVVSEKPGFIGNNDGDIEHNSSYTLVALVGQVSVDPEMITIEKGEISTLDGKAVGHALAGGKVLLSIRNYGSLIATGDSLGGMPSGINADGTAFGIDGGLYWNSKNKLLGLGVSDPTAKLEIISGDVAVKGMIIKAVSGQIANLSEWQDSAGALLLAITSDGKLSFGGEANLYRLAEGILATDGSFEVAGDLRVAGAFTTKPASIQMLGSSMQIDSTSAKIKVAGLGGAVTMVSLPTLAVGQDGQIVIVQGTDESATVTLQSESVLPGSGLKLGVEQRILGKGDILTLTFDADDKIWYEISYSNN